ncbi:MAG: hypothetical protein GXX99_05870 [Clostridiales bacterium]|nr:hypothetical protein [Clostridiales bacterium]
MRTRVVPLLTTAAILLFGAGILLMPGDVAAAARTAAGMAAGSVLPTLFPFLVLADLAVAMGVTEQIGSRMGGLMSRLFRQPGAAGPVLALGLLSGYPVGAAAAVKLYRAGGCTREQGGRLLALCNNTGPAFAVGVVGAALWGSARVGWMLYLCHLLAALLSGVLLAARAPSVPQGRPGRKVGRAGLGAALTASIKGAAMTSLYIAAYIVFFGVLIALLRQSGLLQALTRLLPGDGACWEALLSGAIEMTTGIALTTALPLPARWRLALQSLLMGLAGLSVLCQVQGVLEETDLPMGPYLKGKLLQGGLAALLTYALFPLFRPVLPASAVPAPVTLSPTLFWLMVLLTVCAFVLSALLALLLARLADRVSERYGWDLFEHLPDPLWYPWV